MVNMAESTKQTGGYFALEDAVLVAASLNRDYGLDFAVITHQHLYPNEPTRYYLAAQYLLTNDTPARSIVWRPR